MILIPATVILLYRQSELQFGGDWIAVILMIAGTIIASSIGRVIYQIALTVTGGDNGFVTMFLESGAGADRAGVPFVLSWWIADLHFAADPMFFFGMALVAASLLLFSLKAWRQPPRPA